MKDHKFRLETFAFYDHSGIERHLEKMAAKGWMLEKITPMGWRYVRIPPRQRRFAVTYYPKATGYDPGPSEAQESFYELCAYTGWQLAASDVQMQIFYNDQTAPLPLETDPALEVETVHQAVKKRGYLVAWVIALAAGLFCLLPPLFDLYQLPLLFFGSGQSLFLVLTGALLVPTAAVELWSYNSWHAEAKQAAEQGVFLATKSHRTLQMVDGLIFFPAFVYWVLTSPPRQWFQPVLVVVIAIAAQYLRQFLQARKAEAEMNKAIYWGFVLCLALVVGLIAGSTTLLNWERTTVDHWKNDPPLVTADLTIPEDWEQDFYFASGDESPLLGYFTYGKSLFRTQGLNWDMDFAPLRYTLAAPKHPALYGLCERFLSADWDGRHWWQHREECPAEPWGAQKAYRLVSESEAEQEVYRYLLLYPSVVVDISFTWPPSEKQMALVMGRLGMVELPVWGKARLAMI